MKKFFIIIPTIFLSVFLLTSVCFASEIQPPIENEQQKTVTGARLVIDNQYRFVKLGESPDFSQAQIEVTYYDGSGETVPYDESYLLEWQGEKTGRRLAKLSALGIEFDEFFMVYDDTVNALNFKDVYKTYWGYKHISKVAKAGIFVGVTKDKFGITDNMTRAQFCQMVYRLYQNDSKVLTRHKQVQFTDVVNGSWYYEAVIACAESEIVKGMGDGIFSPDSPITRQDVAVIMMRILLGPTGADSVDVEKTLAEAREQKGIKALDFDSTSGYAKKYVAAALGVIYYGDNNGNINPTQNITRSECAAMIDNMFFEGYTEPKPKRLVYLSPSNQNSNQYSIYDRNDSSTHMYTEGLQMQKVTDKVAELLKEMGYEVHIANFNLSIRGDEESRPIEAGKMGADAYVAIHSNGIGGNDGKYQGTICYYNGNNEGSKELSDFIYNKLSALTPTQDGGSRNDMLEKNPFTEVKNPTMANVLIEVEYHDYPQYATWIVTHTDEIAEAIALGIDQYLSTL